MNCQFLTDTHSEEMKAAHLTFAEIKTNYIPNGNNRCKVWSSDEYLKNQKDLFLNKTIPLINCTIYNMRALMNQSNVSLPVCDSYDTAADTFVTQTNYFFSLPMIDFPCSKTSYEYKIAYQSNHSYFDPKNRNKFPNGYFHLNMFFHTLEVEERTETFVYDIVNFLSAAGGNLGLFIGFSCFSVLCSAIDLLGSHLNKIF